MLNYEPGANKTLLLNFSQTFRDFHMVDNNMSEKNCICIYINI